MKKMKSELTAATSMLLCFITIGISSLLGEEARSTLPLIPYPQELKLQQGVLTPDKNLVLTYAVGNADLSRIAETCVQDFTAIGFSATHGREAPQGATVIGLAIMEDEDLGGEGYRITVDAKVSITAATPQGLFWGTRTLLQLLHGGPQKALAQLTINDKPEFEYRGLLIDNARRVHSLDFHLKTIKRLASYKLNRYQIHFSDNEGYTLPSAAFPELPTKNRHYTREQINTLVATAQQYHVMIVPEIDVPGHSAALTRGISNLICTDMPQGAGKLCIGEERTYEVLDTLFGEICEMIPGEYWHLGADEVSYKGHTCTACASRMEREKLKDGAQLFNYFINRMHGIVKSKGRKMLVWEGFAPTLEPLVDRDIIVCPFDVKHRGHMPSDYFKAGYNVLNTAWSPLYVADNISMSTPEIIARWSPYMFGAGRSPQSIAYWKKFDAQEYQGRIIGAQMCSWAIEEKAEEGLLFGTGPGFHNYGRPGPRVQIMAERIWSGSRTTTKDLLERAGAAYWD